MMRGFWLAVILCLPLPDPAQGRETVARVGPASVVALASVNDGVIQYNLTKPLAFAVVVDGEIGLEVNLPNPVTNSPGWAQLRRESPSVASLPGNRVRWQQTIVLDALLPLGKHSLTLEPLRFRTPSAKWQSIDWPPLAIAVVPPTTSAGELRDITSIEELPVTASTLQRNMWLTLAVVGAALVLLFLVMRVRRSRRVPAALSASERALHELARIRSLATPGSGGTVRFHGMLANVVRNFLENRFRIHARRRTTDELREDIAAVSAFTCEQKNELLRFLDDCDTAKFARTATSTEECTQRLTWVTSFVQSFQQPETITMNRSLAFLLIATFAFAASPSAIAGPASKPNIIFILADDLGYGDLGCYGQAKIKTPALDKLAAQGMRFTQFYAGSTVCAPSRCALMVGQHTGHCLIRGNARVPLRPEDVTIAEILKALGYTTGLVGKWGLGEPDSTGVPNLQGFDYFFGYLNQHHAHNYYPDYLWRNQQKVPLKNVIENNNNFARTKVEYSHDLFAEEALQFVRKHSKEPFFLYLAMTIPHANNELGKAGMETPSDEPYTKQPWPQNQKNHAAMITRMDRDIGRLMALLQELGIDDNTIVLFTSDNGPHREGGNDPTFFASSGVLRGIKRSLHEGGIRVPMIVRWPGKIKAGTTSDHAGAFWDVLPTLAELAGGEAVKTDGISFVPTLFGKEQKSHDFLYWEFHEAGFLQGVRMGHWKAVRKLGTPMELYNLDHDLREENDIAAQHPEIVARIDAYLKGARTPSAVWPGVAKKKGK